MSEGFPKYQQPPIIELVLGVQFDPIPGFTTGHSGWFWRDHLGSEWKASEAPPVPVQTEDFGPPQPHKMAFHISQNAASRLMVENENGDRLLQVQNSRIHYNWRKRDVEYPHFGPVFDEFNKHLEAFKAFVSNAGLKPVELNQWEVTYIDAIPSGSLWNSPGEFASAFPGLFPSNIYLEGLSPNTSSVERSYEIVPQTGRLHIGANLAFLNGGDLIPTLVVNMTARGPINSKSDEKLKSLMKVGHKAAGKAFDGLSSASAKASWKPMS